jgi:CheY-like chemotaxis protein
MAKKIVWVEDDIPIIKSVVRPLELAGYEIISLYSVAEAEGHMEDIKSADLLLFDMISPAGSGNEGNDRYPGLRLLRHLIVDEHIHTPVIVMTVVTNPVVLEELNNLKISDVIHKPVKPSDLKACVERILGGA